MKIEIKLITISNRYYKATFVLKILITRIKVKMYYFKYYLSVIEYKLIFVLFKLLLCIIFDVIYQNSVRKFGNNKL